MFFKALRLILGVGCLAAPLSAARFSTFRSGGPEGGEISSLAFQPGSSSVVLAGSGNNGVFRSTDGGVTWSTTDANLNFVYTVAVVFDPTSRDIAYAAGNGTPNFERSTDGGKTWRALGTGLTSAVRSLSIDPIHTANLLAGTDNGVFRSTDAGATWHTANSGVPSGRIASLSIDPANPSVALAAPTLGAIVRSTDGGATWNPVTGLSATPKITGLAFDPAASTLVYAGGDRLYRSTDGGATWQAVSSSGFNFQAYDFAFVAPATILAASNSYLEQSTDGGVSWASLSSRFTPRDAFVNSVAIEPSGSSNILVATGGSGVVRSTDSGLHWSVSNQGIVGNEEIDTLAIQPDNSANAVAGSNLYGAYRTTDGGRSWSAIDTFDTFTAAVAVPLTPPRIVVGFQFPEIITDGGANWTTFDTQIDNEIQSLAACPTNPQILYAGTNEKGAWRSTDAGTTWVEVSNGLPQGSGVPNSVLAVACDAGSASTAYAASYDDENTEYVKVYKTTNSGTHWSEVGTGLPAAFGDVLTSDPVNPGVLYAGTYAGLFKSTDGGAHWVGENTGSDSTTLIIRAIAVVSGHPEFVLAGTDGSGVILSTDAGEHWANISEGLPSLGYGMYVGAIATDSSGTHIYAGTPAGVFQRFPAPLVAIGSQTTAHVTGRSGK